MTPAQAIQTATTVAAEMMGWQDRIGSIEKGKFADIVAVSGNPLKGYNRARTSWFCDERWASSSK